MKTTRVSVVVPAHDNAATIQRALLGVQAQRRHDLEVLVVDDASTDDTAARAEALGCPCLRVLRRTTRGGAAVARNTALAEARGELVAFLDADDEWLPGKLERQVAVLDSHPDVALVSCNSEFLGPDGQRRGLHHDDHPPVRGADAWRTLLARNFLPTPTVLVRRASVEAVGLFDEDLPVAEDLDLWLRVAERFPIAVLDDVLVRCHERVDSLMRREAARVSSDTWTVVERHLRAQRERLGRGEVRRIRGRRWFDQGGSEFFAGQHARRVGSLLRAVRHGHRPFKALQVAARAMLLSALGGRLPWQNG